MGRDARGDPAAALLEVRGGWPALKGGGMGLSHVLVGARSCDAAHNLPSCCLCSLLSVTQVLDPEQNAAFVDTYLGLPFDLSSALFVATANRASDIPPPLLDRLEVVQLGGYTLEEKVGILLR